MRSQPATHTAYPGQLFRLGVDWGRVIPSAPTKENGSVADVAALARYRQIVEARCSWLALAPRHSPLPRLYVRAR